MTVWELVGWMGFYVAGTAAAVGVFLVAVHVMQWRHRRRLERASARLIEMGERGLRQERAAVVAVVRPHGRRVICESRGRSGQRRQVGGG